MNLFVGKGPEIEMIFILPIIGFTGISGKFFSQGLPMLDLLKNIGLYAISYKIRALMLFLDTNMFINGSGIKISFIRQS